MYSRRAAQRLLNALTEETRTESVHIDLRDAYIVFKVLYPDMEYETVKIPFEDNLTMRSSIIQDVLMEVRKRADIIRLTMELDEYGWRIGVTS